MRSTGGPPIDLLANILITLLVLQLVWQYALRFGKDTIGNPRVPQYYQTHGIREIVLSATLAGIMLVCAWRTQATSLDLVLLTLAGTGLVGSYWVAVAFVGLGRQFPEDDSDDLVPHVNHAIQAVVLVLALGLKWASA